MKNLKDSTFEENVLKIQFALVAFISANSGISYIQSSILKKLEKDYENRISIYQIDFEKNRKSVDHFKIYRVPTILFFKYGELVDQWIGSISREELVARINRIMGSLPRQN